MTRQNVQECCRSICAGYNENGVCCFADDGGLLGFIDTSQGQNGTRGIAFSEDRVRMNFDGDTIEIFYKRIKSVQIINSFEDLFADELSVVYYSDDHSEKEIRISDFSLDKSELKGLLDALCGDDTSEKTAAVPEKSGAPKNNGAVSQIGAFFPQNTGNHQQNPVQNRQGGSAPVPERRTLPDPNRGQAPANSDRIAERQPSARNNSNNDIPPVFQQRDDFVDIVFEDRAPVITETVLPKSSGTRTTVIEKQTPPSYNDDEIGKQTQTDNSRGLDEDETAERIRIQNMSHEETMSFLAQSFNEINNSPAPAARSREVSRRDDTPLFRSPEVAQNDNTPLFRQPEMTRRESGALVQTQTQTQSSQQLQAQPTAQSQAQQKASSERPVRPIHNEEQAPLTEEPIWGDIYIKASRNLRELCESGRLSMKQIETELDNKLLDSARAFAEITADESKVPKVLIPKITELKEAARNFDTYFQSGEDIGVRAMFFMMYQMLSYADRIVETPETKERLNDFFRRFGTAGITLSMLDMRV